MHHRIALHSDANILAIPGMYPSRFRCYLAINADEQSHLGCWKLTRKQLYTKWRRRRQPRQHPARCQSRGPGDSSSRPARREQTDATIAIETSRAGHPMLFYDDGQCLHLPDGNPDTTVGAIVALLMQHRLLCPDTRWQACYRREFTPGFQPAAQNAPVHCVVDLITCITYRPAPHPASRQYQPHQRKRRQPQPADAH